MTRTKLRPLQTLAALLVCLLLTACGPRTSAPLVTPEDIPAYDGQAYIAVNGNRPYFTDDDLTEEAFETYAPLDALNRCGTAYANVGVELMPTEERGSIGQVKPSGWQSAKYDCVDGKYLYNRCHLIGYQLTGENANAENLITGTRYLNIDGMLPFENMVTDFVKETQMHVLYRVTPLFTGDNLVADGVLMEGLSVEDGGEGISFCVFAYNVQPGVDIDYATGESRPAGQLPQGVAGDYVLNTGTKKFHHPDCPSAKKTKEANKELFHGTREELLQKGYEPCGRCKP